MNLSLAEKYAEKIGESIAPFCCDIQIVGSIRRKRPECGDIDLVVMPLDIEGLKARCRQTCQVIQEGQVNLSYTLPSGVRLDIYVAHPGAADLAGVVASNWGSLVLCRTGSLAHNIKIIEWAKTRNMLWKPYVGVLDVKGMVIASETEEEIFRAVGMSYIDPEKREAL